MATYCLTAGSARQVVYAARRQDRTVSNAYAKTMAATMRTREYAAELESRYLNRLIGKPLYAYDRSQYTYDVAIA